MRLQQNLVRKKEEEKEQEKEKLKVKRQKHETMKGGCGWRLIVVSCESPARCTGLPGA